jgi:apolipoprotein N-acyltransferase
MEALHGDSGRVRVWGCLAGALGSAVLVRLSTPTFDFASLAFMAWVPLLLLVGRVPARSLFGWAYLQSLLLNLAGHWWMVPALRTVADAPILTASAAFTLVAAAQAARTPLIFLAVHWAKKHRVPVWASFPVAVPVMESVFPQLFPWSMALQVQAQPIWLQLAALGGPGAAEPQAVGGR